MGTLTTPASTTTPKPENKPVGSANVVYDFDGDGFWMVNEEEADLAPIKSTELDPLLGDPDDVEVAPQSEGEEDDPDPDEKEWAGAVITPVDEDSRIRIELYDSGATQHISPFKSDFISYTPLEPPIYLNAANQQHFPAIRRGTLIVQVPNGGTRESKLTLHGTLHVPAVGCTLVSLAALDEEGYHAHIGAGHLDLTSPQGERIGRLP